jgi:hypothetical protein
VKGRPELIKSINRFIMARYGLFLCYDDLVAWGEHKYLPNIIKRFEKNDIKVKELWYQALMYAISDGVLTWEEMEKYRKHHKQSKAFLKELRH